MRLGVAGGERLFCPRRACGWASVHSRHSAGLAWPTPDAGSDFRPAEQAPLCEAAFQSSSAGRFGNSSSSDWPSCCGQCSASSAKPVVFASAVPQGVAAVPVTVEVAASATDTAWRCYRYRAFETIVPLRNAIWRP